MTTAVQSPSKPQVSQEEAMLAIRARRHRARTDLFFLMTDLLGYKDVDREVHAPVIDGWPHFAGGIDRLEKKGWTYRPLISLWDQEGLRKSLTLFPRGHLKTTIKTVSRTIQWILNYPNIRVSITTATADLGQSILLEMKAHFQFNERFRWLFPDYCPIAKKSGEFGNQEQFTVPARTRVLKEPTVSVSSVGRTIAGNHYEVLVCSDMVDKENVKTPGGIREVIDHFRYMDPLLERHEQPEDSKLPNHGWITVEGTRYDMGDLYGNIIAAAGVTAEKKQAAEWDIVSGSAEKDPANKISIWPRRFPWAELKKMELNMGPRLYSAQMLNRPIPDGGGLASLEDLEGIFIKRHVLVELLQTKVVQDLHVTVDLASMQEEKTRGDYIVLTLAGFDRIGRMYVVEIRRAYFTEMEVINQFYDLHAKYPNIIDFKVEKEAHWRTLKPFLMRTMPLRGYLPRIVDMQRDNRTSKQQRIYGLQPWFKSKSIRFADDIPCKTDLLAEITNFPSASLHDDILDTLADQMQNAKGEINPDIIAEPNAMSQQFGQPRAEDRFMGFDPISKEARFLYDQIHQDSGANYHAGTGM